MERTTVLLIDQRLLGTQSNILRILARHCSVHHVSGSEHISYMIQRFRPDILCFEYDDPDFEGLTALRETKKIFPSIPILLFTERGSEALAVWALRSRVWDYFVTPVAEEELLQRIRSLCIVAKRSSGESSRRLLMPPTQLPSEERLTERSNVRTLQAAINYIDGHFHEEILQYTLAQACGMSPSQFSRSFKQHYGTTFQNFLTQRRIREAARLLQNLSDTVTEVCFAVGFNDLSHFARTFRRHLGVTPSMYKRAFDEESLHRNRSSF